MSVDLHTEQITHGIRVFRPIQTMEIGGPAWVRARGGGTIELRLEPRSDGIVGRVVRPPASWRRHRARTQLHDDLLPRLHRVEHVLRISAAEIEIGCLELVVVTGDAVVGNEIANRSGGHGSGSRCWVLWCWVLVPGSEFQVLGSEFCVQ